MTNTNDMREEMIELLRNFQQRMAAKRGMCDEHDGALWDNAESVIASLQAAEPDVILDYEFDDDDPDARGDLVFHWTGRGELPAGTEFYAQLPCPPAKAQVQGELYGYVYDGQLLCDEQDFADYFDGAQYDISTMTPVYTAAAAAVPDGYVLLPKELSAENGAKALLMNEFYSEVVEECPDCDSQSYEGDNRECELCSGEGVCTLRVTVSWSTIKNIWRMAVDNLTASPHPAETEEKSRD